MQTAAFVLLPESTSPARGTTGTLYPQSNTLNDFNPRPPHGGRRSAESALSSESIFQSTSPARGTTAKRIPRFFWRLNFNPRPPHGGRRCSTLCRIYSKVISIHVPRMGGRHRVARSAPCSRYFNPRPPHGGRRVAVGAVVAKVAKFQSASPAWGDDFCQLRLHVCLFSIKRKLAG